jgi:2-keto-4-pentenoate hydratase
MTDPQHDAAARALRDAYSKGAIAPMRQWLDPVDIAGAYAVQAINTRFWMDQGRRIVGRKAGLTAKAVQQQLGVDQPDFGVLFDDMEIKDGGTLDPARCLQPKAEAEIAFVLGADLLDPNTTAEMAGAAVATVHAAIEIVDSRIADWKIAFADTVADNGSSAFLCPFGSRQAARRARHLQRGHGDGNQRPDRLAGGRGRSAGPSAQCRRLAGLNAGATRGAADARAMCCWRVRLARW